MRNLLLIIAGILALFSCGESEERIEESLVLSPSRGIMNVGDTLHLEATKECHWSSDNTFIAGVSTRGVVKAFHIGKAVITATPIGNSSLKASCEISVEALYYTYKEPILDFGISRSELIGKESRTFLRQSGNSRLAFDGENSIVDRVNYYFSDDDKLIQADVVIFHNYSDVVKNSVDAFLKERYALNDRLNSAHSVSVENGFYYLTNGDGDDYDIIVYHYPYAACFGSTSLKWGNYRWTIIYTYKGREPIVCEENW